MSYYMTDRAEISYGNILICFYMCQKTKALNRHLTCVQRPYTPTQMTLFQHFSHILPCNLEIVQVSNFIKYNLYV